MVARDSESRRLACRITFYDGLQMEETLTAPDDEVRPGVAAGRPLLRGWFHAIALVVFLVAGPLLIAQAKTTGQTVCLVIYVISVASLFGVSAAFHRIRWKPAGRRRMRRADHSTIFIAIAGTYTAVGGLALTGWARVVILCIAWGGAAIGITLRQAWLDAPKWAIALPYLVVGWAALTVLPQLLRGLGGVGFTLVVVGGLFYTAGAIVYSLKKPDPIPKVFGYHEVFHACTVVGAVLHFVAVAAFALPHASHA
jgi:hemolysin III